MSVSLGVGPGGLVARVKVNGAGGRSLAGELVGVVNRAREVTRRVPACSWWSSASIASIGGSRGGRNRRRRRGQWLPRLGLHRRGGKCARIWASSGAFASWHRWESKARSRPRWEARKLGGRRPRRRASSAPMADRSRGQKKDHRWARRKICSPWFCWR